LRRVVEERAAEGVMRAAGARAAEGVRRAAGERVAVGTELVQSRTSREIASLG
jgi:hypothetical protein